MAPGAMVSATEIAAATNEATMFVAPLLVVAQVVLLGTENNHKPLVRDVSYIVLRGSLAEMNARRSTITINSLRDNRSYIVVVHIYGRWIVCDKLQWSLIHSCPLCGA